MKKLAFLFLSHVIISCGKDKKNATKTPTETDEPVVKYSIVIEGIYEKDDSLLVVYKKNGYMNYDFPVSYIVKGNALIQKFTIDLPTGDYVENFQVTLSTNKAQKEIKIPNISVLLDGKTFFDGSAMKHSEYFSSNEGLKWNDSKKTLELIFSGKYLPGISGNEKLEAALKK